MITYLNIKTAYGVETVDQLNRKDFKIGYEGYIEYLKELKRLKNEYRLASNCYSNIYSSQRCTNDWKNN